jgi:dTDP-4-dehydrorhamnose reductase
MGKRRVLITGAKGLLGRELAELFREEYEVRATDETECDVTSPSACREVFGAVRPDVVLHCAAYTAVDRAESEEERAMAVNRDGTRNVACACREHGAFLVTFGTDYIFDGTSGRPYAEGCAHYPRTAG